MGFWSWLTSEPSGNTNSPGDTDGVELVGFETTYSRSLPQVLPSPWAGWPASWGVPNWDFGSRLNELVDVAWNCLDLNARVLSSMPVYRTRSGEIIEPTTWMTNPDPMIYTSWHEFAKQMFWDFQIGEAFIISMARFSDGFPQSFRVVPPWLMHVEVSGQGREYRLGGPAGVDVTDDILHIRYKSTIDGAHGVGPLESAGARMLTAGVLAKYIRDAVSTGGVPAYTLETDTELETEDAEELLERWVSTRAKNLGYPPVLDNSVKLKTHFAMSPKDMAMVEIAQFTEGRIADLLGVPRALVGLPTGDSFTYSNVSSWFDHHDRTTLRPHAAHVMGAVSGWTLPRGQAAELNRDEYSRPAFHERAMAFAKLKEADLITTEQYQEFERLLGKAPATALTGGDLS